MKKKISVLALMLCCLLILAGCCSHEWLDATCEAPKTCAKCGETEGEALGHSWADATCTAPKICSVCHAQEGSALGHDWIDATTEAPMTCAACAITEGERIITDPRFTTASTKDLYGKWVSILELTGEKLGFEGLDEVLRVHISLELDNQGCMTLAYAGLNVDEFATAVHRYMEASLYESGAAAGLSKELLDAAMMQQYGMTVSEFAESYISADDLAASFESLSSTGVYYVDGELFYIGASWDAVSNGSPFTLDGDTLTLVGGLNSLSEKSLVFHRSAE